MGETPWPVVRRADLEGIPVHWVDAPPPHEAELVFRVGRADETLATAGLTHLVEHLAMPAERPPFECNAWVGETFTGFWARGAEDEIAGFLADTVARLRALPLERLEVEKQILRAEEASNGVDPVSALYGPRFGAAGFGLVACEQLGLRRIDEEETAAWTRRFFTRGNAALWVRGPLPALDLQLPDGERHPPPVAATVDWAAFPAYVTGWPDGIWMTLVGPHDPASMTGYSVLEERLTKQLRYERGLVYAVEARHTALTAELTHMALWAECPGERTETVLDAFLAIAAELGGTGPTAGELAREVEGHRRVASDQASLPGLLASLACEELLGLEPELPEEYSARLAALTGDEVAAALGAAFRTALVGLPDEVSITGGAFTAFPDFPPLPAVSGREIKRSRLAFGAARRERLVIGPEGVTVSHPDGTSITVRFDACAAVLAWPDGTRGLWGEHGVYLEIWPVHWRDGPTVTRLIDEHAPAAAVVEMTADDPKRFDPAAEEKG